MGVESSQSFVYGLGKPFSRMRETGRAADRTQVTLPDGAIEGWAGAFPFSFWAASGTWTGLIFLMVSGTDDLGTSRGLRPFLPPWACR